MSRPRAVLPLLLVLGLCGPTATGCTPASTELNTKGLPPMPPLPPEDPEDSSADQSANQAADTLQATAGSEQTATLQTPPTPDPAAPQPASAPGPELPPSPQPLEAGDIPRSTLYAVLSDGIGHFLQRVQTEPHLTRGRFVGWRLLTAPAEDGALRSGDTVLRVNGQSIERPEQFKNVWDSMATSSELILDVRRAGKDGRVRYKIVD